MSNFDISPYLQQINLPKPDSHKGQNGKLLLIGGSDLFHAASKWSLDMASKLVDMVFYSSVPSNNDLIQQAKGEFWNGIVIARSEIENYADEADVILIGPGMERIPETETLTNHLLEKYADKKWVIDAGALQMVDPTLLTEKCIITPHHGELQQLVTKVLAKDEFDLNADSLQELSQKLQGACLLVKGKSDWVVKDKTVEEITGGNAGMTKGGTGDALAGLVAGLYCGNDALTSAVVGSYINKKAGDSLFKTVGPFFNTSDLVLEVPKVLWSELQPAA